ncbi:hypothetical protein FGO68_gene53 [Halteria grandinella]|uniref:Uncharacterized protein n=1 Tax=Halteria grandinella TaxID=5974 RepID=A0A8J8NK53_HALGN|nr:hypothetical protein FGO68_gene53 [Halteria grandinella]
MHLLLKQPVRHLTYFVWAMAHRIKAMGRLFPQWRRTVKPRHISRNQCEQHIQNKWGVPLPRAMPSQTSQH